MEQKVFVGTAGWSIPAEARAEFPLGGSALWRYSRRFSCCEINSTFHRRHRPETFAHWAASVDDDFAFILKLPKTITHNRKLKDCADLLAEFLADSQALGSRRRLLLVQLPPSLSYEPFSANQFFAELRRQFPLQLACEPRHSSWFEAELDQLWQRYQIARVAADPAHIPAAAEPGGWRGLSYYRWHGSPRMYYSVYPGSRLEWLCQSLRACPGDAFCVFDNTASGAATGNGLELLKRLNQQSPALEERK